MKTKPAIGDIAKDNVTGFTGLIDAEIKYLTGCTQFRIQPRELKEGKIQESVWFDENRITVTKKAVIDRVGTDTGGPSPSIPARRYPQ
jgi:hypothetical protein